MSRDGAESEQSVEAQRSEGTGAQGTRKTILSVAFPYAPLGAKAVGGAEVICSQMEAALVAAGYNSVVVGHADSAPVGQMYGTEIPAGVIGEASRAEVEAAQQANLDRALREHPVALVHMHGLDFHRYQIPEHVPVLVTLHLPPAWYPETIWALPPQYHFVCVSETQRRSCPAAAQGRVQVIGNGVPLGPRSDLRPEGRYALMLARICEEKNLHTGLDAARLAGMPALLAGEVFSYEAHLQYFATEIEPRVLPAGSGHAARQSKGGLATARFLGAVAGEEKARLLSRAACLLLPSLAPETSSLVAMEALAAGVPVIGMAVGAVPEIVEPGVTGFLIQPGEHAVREMAEAIVQVSSLDRQVCRTVAEERFPLARMVEGYLASYAALALPDAERCPAGDKTPAKGSVRSGSTESAKVRAEAGGELKVEHLTDKGALHGLAPSWEELWRKDPGASPFQHPAWLLPWWRQFGPDGHLQAIALRERSTEALVGLLPVYTYAAPGEDSRQMLFVGAGTTDYLDGVWDGGSPALAAEALRAALGRMRAAETVQLRQLRRGSPLLVAAGDAGLAVEPAEPCAVVSSRQELPAKLRANVARYRRRAEVHGSVRCRLAATREEALADFELMVSFHRERWEGRGEEGVLSDPRVCSHHRESLPLLQEAGLLRIFRLDVAGEPAGVLYGLADGEHAAERQLLLYLIGFHPRFAAFSPGTLLVHAAWTHAREHGLGAVDLLRGGERYKQFWGARTAPTFALVRDNTSCHQA